MNKEEIDYWLKEFYDRKHAFMSKDGKVLVYYKIFEELKKLQQENQQLKEQIIHKHKYASEMEGKYILEKAKLEQLRSWLEEDNDKIKVLDSKDNDSVKLGIVIGLGMCVDKLNELEGGKSE